MAKMYYHLPASCFISCSGGEFSVTSFSWDAKFHILVMLLENKQPVLHVVIKSFSGFIFHVLIAMFIIFTLLTLFVLT